MKTTQTLTILENGIFTSKQVFTDEKNLRQAVQIMREQLHRKISLRRLVRGVFSCNIHTPVTSRPVTY